MKKRRLGVILVLIGIGFFVFSYFPEEEESVKDEPKMVE